VHSGYKWFGLLPNYFKQSGYCYPANEPQKVTLKVLVADVIAILGTEPARLSVLQVSGHYR